MATLPLGASLMQGDFLDGVVESTLRSAVVKLKAEYQKELKKALEAASLETASGARVARVDVSPVGLTLPVSTLDQLRSAGKLQTSDASGSPASQRSPKTAPEVPPFPDFWSPTDNKEAWGDSRTSKGSKLSPQPLQGTGNGSLQHPAVWFCDAPPCAGSRCKTDKWHGKLSETEQDTLKTMREEAIEKEEAVLASGMRNSRAYAMGSWQLAHDEPSQCRKLLYKLITLRSFDFGMGVVIMLNALTIGMETSIARQGREMPTSLHMLEYTFLLIYCVELVMRLYISGVRVALSNNWVKFDAVMVAAGVLSLFLKVTDFGGSAASGVVDNVNMLKMLRLFRLAKTVRVLVQFRTLWMLIQGLMYAVLPMFWTAVIMSVVIYVFAVIAMEIILPSDANDDYSTAASRYDTLGESMLALMQIMTLDSPATIYRPLVDSKPWLILYFLTFILLGPIALMNIVTAIMVESALRTANEDQEAKKAWDSMKRKQLMPKLKHMFMTMDASGDGEVELQELLHSPPEVMEALQHIVGLDELEEIFHLMDYDGSGSIDIQEFVEGIMRSNSDKPSELFVLVKQGKVILDRLKGLNMRASADALRLTAGTADDGMHVDSVA